MSKLPWVALSLALAAFFAAYYASTSLQPSYEVNASLYLKVRGPGVDQTLPLGWAVVGEWGARQYTWARLALQGVYIDVYSATEGGRNYTSLCVGDICQKVQLPVSAAPATGLVKLGEAKTGELGPCSHLGKVGRLYKVEVPLDWSLVSEITRQPTVANSTVEGYFCEEGKTPLWALIRVAITFHNGQTFLVEYHINATRTAPFNQSRYQEVLKRAKG
ncbi:MAG: hypothetical protein QXP31_00245 [Pyrobaculum sp.]